jgi:hypothetical protein
MNDLNEKVVDISTKSQATILDKISTTDARVAIRELNTLVETTKRELSDVNDKVVKTNSQLSNTFVRQISSLQESARATDAAAAASADERFKLLESINEYIQKVPEKAEKMVSREISDLHKTIQAYDMVVTESKAEMEKLVKEQGKLLEDIHGSSSRTENAVSRASKNIDETLDSVNKYSSETVEAFATNRNLLASITNTVEEAPSKLESTMAHEVAALEAAIGTLVRTSSNETVQAVKVTQNLLSKASDVVDCILDKTASLTVAVETMDHKVGSISTSTSTAASKFCASPEALKIYLREKC